LAKGVRGIPQSFGVFAILLSAGWFAAFMEMDAGNRNRKSPINISDAEHGPHRRQGSNSCAIFIEKPAPPIPGRYFGGEELQVNLHLPEEFHAQSVNQFGIRWKIIPQLGLVEPTRFEKQLDGFLDAVMLGDIAQKFFRVRVESVQPT
jgi:hypothetical protein